MEKIRDYDKNPIVIRNNYLLKRFLTTSILFLGFMVVLALSMHFFGIPRAVLENDTLDIKINKTAMIVSILAAIIYLIHMFRIIVRFSKKLLYIKIFNEKITYDYITEKNKLKTFVLQKENIKTISWSFFPFAILEDKDEIWITDIKDKDKKRWAYLGMIFTIPLSFFIQIIYFIVNSKIEKYVLLRFEGGIIAIPYNDFPDNKNIKFEWKSLDNLEIFGGYYFGK